ncbi:2-succinyl-5-enolpyruvyl-6-hydroxy-3-cyclohexene-1-carboxylic-acid synthase [Algoriphagus zhangzhouensis]|uniref:2-succinyl-5-enolpyruvyl-6-hydroxy-3-cyclohexene-1-carboxylate synthase n=1 Tax=Algoriphagus zhangzhouensis TaxID=1073327 RepID=A0A1M7Z7U7_9BACT|nr:2-succinyl-5-enolpyruvyl-6-hydroxy-3-cyclohexene-1-carboxylic-acid synthase [Algoriphagus zhangzhouensis]TDY49378.1 2-succinyl-5-enolpyruvyl-6-hydroxy-3-cyclohexene-1-carboxylate synthase [Algoriphagus zhangzhouensis]SHO60850.1 2-succinyl-5-enolpyruvyl-6-hydroxy-3-cyclohexene-1-carboxylate synthase [Algoriphagus zhangzhouensis]
MILQPIIDLVAICAKKGIKNVILSPGSRCAPLTLAFARHPEIHARTISDERSAAFIAMGMAQQLDEPVALVCTSGSAALNYFPAVAEAFFQNIPLLILTADRPPEWIDQWDGQTIFQPEVYGKHVKGSFQFPDSYSHPDQIAWASRISNEAINLSQTFPKGPVHINIPLREPFYPSENEAFEFPEDHKITHLCSSHFGLSSDSKIQLQSQLKDHNRILILAGQQNPNPEIQTILDKISKEKNVVVVTDTISNMQSGETINLHDHWVGNEDLNQELKPDLIISFGKSIISKPLKLFLRKCDVPHWHIQEDGRGKDVFQSLSQLIPASPENFLCWLLENISHLERSYYARWHDLNSQTEKLLETAFQELEFGEFSALKTVLSFVPKSSKIHVANSMSVRYLNQLGARTQEIYCNRGTSGIDGSNSTAVGCTFTTKDPVTLITGDLAFFYDRNAFWHNYTMPNLRIILLNNHAGGIFRMIDGPKKQPELEEYFETRQALTAENLAKEFHFNYTKVSDQKSLTEALQDFYSPSIHPKTLEIESKSSLNEQQLKKLKGLIRDSLF